MEYLNDEKVYKLSSKYMLRELCGEYAIIPIGTDAPIQNAVMSPNETAVFIWKAFAEPNTEEAVVAKVLEEFDGPEDAIRKGVRGFILDGIKFGILLEDDKL